MSYPHVLHYEGEIYMLPQGIGMTLYKCISFPTKWKMVADNLLGISLVDITTVYYQNRWWAFGLHERFGKEHWKLHIYYADKLTGPWLPTPHNCFNGKTRGVWTCIGGENVTEPHYSGSKFVRPGGRMFVDAGKLYRIAQDSAKHYGDDLNMFEITKLTIDGKMEDKLIPSFRESLRSKDNVEEWNRNRYHHADLHMIPGKGGGPPRWVMLIDGDYNLGRVVAPKDFAQERCADV
jgi:hypothetical protein